MRRLVNRIVTLAFVALLYGAGVYKGSPQLASQFQQSTESSSGSTGLAPTAPHR
jgi:hypothetical protein